MLTKIKENQCFHQVTANDSYDTALINLCMILYTISQNDVTAVTT